MVSYTAIDEQTEEYNFYDFYSHLCNHRSLPTQFLVNYKINTINFYYGLSKRLPNYQNIILF